MVEFDWDVANVEHIGRHGISPDQVEQVFSNLPEEKGQKNRQGEERFIVEGRDDTGRVMMVIATIRNGRIRPITAYPVHGRSLWRRRP
ncbi:MAG: BrnT family toxin [Terriglobales bacterium]